MKVTTSPASSAFMVMMSSLPAHLSILDCFFEKRKYEMKREGGRERGRAGGVSVTNNLYPECDGDVGLCDGARGGAATRHRRTFRKEGNNFFFSNAFWFFWFFPEFDLI